MRPFWRLRQSCPSLKEGFDYGCVCVFLFTLTLAIHRHFWQGEKHKSIKTSSELTKDADVFDPNKCNALLTRGQWLDSAHKHWQPAGCMMQKFKGEDLSACLKHRKITFVGDSTTRQIFLATARKLGFKEQGEEERHTDHRLSLQDVSLVFIWDPYLNSSGLHRELMAASPSASGADIVETPAILLVGGGLWPARYLEDDYLPRFKDSFGQILRIVTFQDEMLIDSRHAGSTNDERQVDSFVSFAPVPVLAYEALSLPRAETITPEKVDTMNLHLQQVSLELQIPVAWSFNLMTAKQETAYQSDGLHVTQDVAASMADVLLSARCNDVLRRSQTRRYPLDKTCCNNYDAPNWTQSLILNASIGLLPFLVLVTYKDSRRLSFLPSCRITRAMMVLALAVCYCYYADRTHLFNKAQKHYNRADFLGLCLFTLMLGILSLRRSTVTLQTKNEAQRLQMQDQPFLSRDQTDEWKGWMQLVILIYHYTGASKILWIYRVIRLLVAAYLFMTGFGHTVFFYKRADYSLRRCAAVLIRLNMLSCILPYVMRTDYLFYYFAPLISFWYIVIYCTMAVGHEGNKSLVFLLSKTVSSALLVNILIRFPGSFEIFFKILARSCNIHWDVIEWRFRLQLDSYIVYVGMLCAVLFIRISDALRSDAFAKPKFDKLVQRHFQHGRFALGSLAVLILPIFFIVARKASSKQEYNSWVPYISPIPILAFIILRNLSRHARNLHSSTFAWIGRHSLETFTLQFHIWLAADTKGLLALGVLERASGDVVDGRRFDMAVLTIIFLWVCWHVAAATQTLTSWLIDPREGREDVEVGEGIDGEDQTLPRTKSKENISYTTGIGHLSDEISAGALRSASRIKRLVAGHLEARLVVIIGFMWLLNMMDA